MESNKVKTIKAGTLLIKENDTTRKMYILKEGKVKVFKNYLGKKITLAVLGKGEVFGELSFFDAQPRSASVEALTDVKIVMISGDEVEKQIKNLPGWINGIFKSVFSRFRENDNKLAILQNMYEFQKNFCAEDMISKTIYTELLRYNKSLQLVYNDYEKVQCDKVYYKDFYKSLEGILGKKDIGLKAYFNALSDNNVFEFSADAKGNHLFGYSFREIDHFNKYLESEVDSERFLMLGTSSLALLRACIGYTDTNVLECKTIRLDQLKLNKMPFFEDAVRELVEHGILREENGVRKIDVSDVQYHYISQSIIKSFDHGSMSR